MMEARLAGETANTIFLASEDGAVLLHRHWRAQAASANGRRTAFIGHTQPTHSGNFDDLGRALSTRGWDTHGGDLRGHGRSTTAGQPLGHLDPASGWDALIADLRHHLAKSFSAADRAGNPVPWGVSWEDRVLVMPNISALLTLELLKEKADLARHIVLVSPPPNQPAISALGRAFVKARALLRRPDTPDPQTLHHVYSFLGAHLPRSAMTGDVKGDPDQAMNDRHLADVMSNDRDVIASVLNDPLAWPTPTLGYWSVLFEGYGRAWRWPRGRTARPGTRVLLLTGEEDPMMGRGALTPPMVSWLHGCGIDDVETQTVPGARSAVLLDEMRLRISDRIVAWAMAAATPAPDAVSHPPPAMKPKDDAATRGEPDEIETVARHVLTDLGAGLNDAALRPEELVELCYSGVDDEERWVEIIYRLVAALARERAERTARTRHVDVDEDAISDAVDAVSAARVVEALMPHWDRSYRLNAQITASAALGIILEDVIERFDVGAAVLSADLVPLTSNAAYRRFLVRHGLLEDGPSKDGGHALAKATAALLGPDATSGIRAGRDTPLMLDGVMVGVSFCPPSLARARLLRGGPIGVLILRDGTATDGGVERLALLKIAHGLTQQEASVALLIVDGRSPEEVSETLGVSIHTVRTHLRRVFGKVGVRGQAELVSRVLAGPIGLLAGAGSPRIEAAGADAAHIDEDCV